MASDSARVDFVDEKQTIDHVEDAATTSIASELELRPELTLNGIDMKNTQALKGDDSDGKVEWNTRSVFAAIFLAALYTGLSCTPSILCISHGVGFLKTNRPLRIPNHPLLYRRVSQLHRRRSQSFSWLGMAPYSQYPRHCCSLPLCGIPAGSLWETLHCPVWLVLSLPRIRARGERAEFWTAACWHGYFRCWSCGRRTDRTGWVSVLKEKFCFHLLSSYKG